MRATGWWIVLLLALPVAFAQPAAPPAMPEGVAYVIGGEPGIHASIDGTDLAVAAHPHRALAVDPDREVNLTLTLAPPPNTTWDVRGIHVAVLVNGPGSSAPGALTRDQGFNATLPPGFTVFVNRTLTLSELKHVGTGLFLMRVDVTDANATALYSQEFYVKIEGNVLLTASGAVVTAASVATGYGLFQILRDLREMYQAHQRHKKEKAKKAHAATKATKLASHAIGLASGLSGMVDVAGDVDHHAEHMGRRRPIAWAATGLGLGGVTLSWLQFLGYVPFNLASTLGWALGLAATMLVAGLLAYSVAKRIVARSETRTLDISVPARVTEEGSRAEIERDAKRRD